MKMRMRHFLTAAAALLLYVLAVMAIPATSRAQDIREAARQAEAERQAARQEAVQAEEAILGDRERLLAEVKQLERQQADLEAELKALEKRIADGQVRRQELNAEWAEKELGFREISGNVRVAARDLESLLKASPLSAGQDWRLDSVSPLLDTGYFPDIDDISGMAAVYLDEMRRGGQVSLREGSFVGRDGIETTGRIFQLGKFTGVYQTDQEIGFLT